LILSFELSIAQELPKRHNNTVMSFINCIRNRDIKKLKVDYPLRRTYPLLSILNRTELLERYDEIFDEELIKMIVSSDLKSDWTQMGTRGIMLGNGILWLDLGGNLIAVNYESDKETIKRENIVERNRNSMHKSLADFTRPILTLETKKFRVRIDVVKGSYRYASWSIDSQISEKPDLILKDGILIPEGSGRNYRYEFSNGEYTYICSINTIGKYSHPAVLVIERNGEAIFYQIASYLHH